MSLPQVHRVADPRLPSMRVKSTGMPRRRIGETLTVHPADRLDLRQPVLCRGNAPQIFVHMLFSDVAHWDLFAFAVGDRDTEDALA